MLQQTQVATMRPYFERWMARWPDFAALATAAEEDVLRQWEGLGYYARARRLLALARVVSALPELPRTAVEWQKLPGIGPYTGAAIASLAFGDPVAVVDGNVVRVLTRLTADATLFRDGPTAARALTPLAERLLDRLRPARHNQAMMELGALICRPRQPQCLLCPVRQHCAAGLRGDAAGFPRLQAKASHTAEVTRLWLVSDGRILLHVTPATARRLAGVAELPTPEQIGLAPGPMRTRSVRRRTIALTTYTETIVEPLVPPHEALPAGPAAEGDGTLVWATLPDLPEVTVSGPHRRWIDAEAQL